MLRLSERPSRTTRGLPGAQGQTLNDYATAIPSDQASVSRRRRVVGLVSAADFEMTTVEVSQQTITLEPPQRIVTLEVTSEERGFCLRISPAGGVEANDLQLVSKTPVPVSTTGTGGETSFDAFDSMAIMRRLSEAFPQLGEIDVMKFPTEYAITFSQVELPFRFESGERSHSGTGEHVWETTAVAK